MMLPTLDNFTLEVGADGEPVRLHAYMGHDSMHADCQNVSDTARLQVGVHMEESDFRGVPEVFCYLLGHSLHALDRQIDWHEAALAEWHELDFITPDEWLARKRKLTDALETLKAERRQFKIERVIRAVPDDFHFNRCHETRMCSITLKRPPEEYPDAQYEDGVQWHAG